MEILNETFHDLVFGGSEGAAAAPPAVDIDVPQSSAVGSDDLEAAKRELFKGIPSHLSYSLNSLKGVI